MGGGRLIEEVFHYVDFAAARPASGLAVGAVQPEGVPDAP
jgi:hypothetical protein